MTTDEGIVTADCQFCGAHYEFDPATWGSRPRWTRHAVTRSPGSRSALTGQAAVQRLRPEPGPASAPASTCARPAVLVPLVAERGRAAGGADQTRLASEASSRAGRVSRRQASIRATPMWSRRRCARRARRSGLPDGAVEVLGTMPPHVTVTGFTVTPVLAVLTRGFDPVAEAGEVEEVFVAPFDLLMNPDAYTRAVATVARAAAALLHGAVRPVLHLGRDGADAAGTGRPGCAVKLSGDWLDAPGTQALFQVFAAGGQALYFVGGCVRNAFWARRSRTSTLPPMHRRKPWWRWPRRRGFKIVPTGIEHGTVTVIAARRAARGHHVSPRRRDRWPSRAGRLFDRHGRGCARGATSP